MAAYAKRFDLLEVRVLVPEGTGAERDGGAEREGATPSLATLRRWRKSVPPHFDFAVVAGPHLSKVKAGDATDRELEAARAAIDALQARCFVLRTTPDVTPTSLWRDRIAKIVDRLPRDVTHFVWEPSGVWETEDAAAQARAWEIVLSCQIPRESPCPRAPNTAYLRLRALGETRAFGPVALERIVKAVGERRDVFAVIETDTALAEAKRLRRLGRDVRSSVKGGMGKLVRPRGGIVVRDDEQGVNGCDVERRPPARRAPAPRQPRHRIAVEAARSPPHAIRQRRRRRARRRPRGRRSVPERAVRAAPATGGRGRCGARYGGWTGSTARDRGSKAERVRTR